MLELKNGPRSPSGEARHARCIDAPRTLHFATAFDSCPSGNLMQVPLVKRTLASSRLLPEGEIMKFFIALITATLLIGTAQADNHSEPNYSKFQSNFYFKCPQPAACVAAFNKMLAAPDIAEKNFEVSLMALGHNGWDDSTHVVSFYFKSAERYAEAGQTFAASPAFSDFLKAGASVGTENQSQTLTTHSVVSGDSRGSRSQVNWTINVTDPATFVPAWQKMSEALSEYPWAAKAYGLQTLLLGNQGWATHQVWAAFDTPVEALNFLEKFYLTPEWQTYGEEVDGAVTMVRSYIANSVVVSNED